MHTKGKLTTQGVHIFDEDNRQVCTVICDFREYEKSKSTSRRLVACWNALEKFSTEDIERANEAYPQGRDRIELILDLTETRKRVAVLESERDELVQMLRDYMNAVPGSSARGAYILSKYSTKNDDSTPTKPIE